MTAAPHAPAGRWPAIRAALVLFHVTAVVVLSFPANRGLVDRRAWQTDNAQADFRAWSESLGGIGVDVSPQDLQARLWELSRAYLRVRRVVAAPFEAYARLTGVSQGWQMMTSPQRHPAELHVAVRTHAKAPWQPVYASRSDTLTWRRDQLDHDRFRKIVGRFARSRDTTSYDRVARWLAKAAAADFPDASGARVTQVRYRVLPPEEVARGDTAARRPRHVRVFDLAALRAGGGIASPSGPRIHPRQRTPETLDVSRYDVGSRCRAGGAPPRPPGALVLSLPAC